MLDAFLFSFVWICELDKFLTVDQYLCFVSFPDWAVGRKTEGADCRAEKDWRCNQVKLNSRITELITEPRRSFTHKTLYKNAYLASGHKVVETKAYSASPTDRAYIQFSLSRKRSINQVPFLSLIHEPVIALDRWFPPFL